LFCTVLQAAASAAAAAGKSKAKKDSTQQAAALPKRPPANPLMLGLPADAYVLRSVAAVRANDLEQALLLLPFNDALRLLQWVSGWLASGAQVRYSRTKLRWSEWWSVMVNLGQTCKLVSY
jgi:U3 small nucleolar RNA-associated protein 12